MGFYIGAWKIDYFWVYVKMISSILLCILEEIAGGGFMSVAVGVSDMQQMTPDTRYVTYDM